MWGWPWDENEGYLRGITEFDQNPRSRVLQHNQHTIAIKKIIHALQENPNQPVILVGHSWGADAVQEVAKKLKDLCINVDLAIQAESVGIGDDELPSNVEEGSLYHAENSWFDWFIEKETNKGPGRTYPGDHMHGHGSKEFQLGSRLDILKTTVKGLFAGYSNKNFGKDPCCKQKIEKFLKENN